jgi:hypothetical protein
MFDGIKNSLSTLVITAASDFSAAPFKIAVAASPDCTGVRFGTL